MAWVVDDQQPLPGTHRVHWLPPNQATNLRLWNGYVPQVAVNQTRLHPFEPYWFDISDEANRMLMAGPQPIKPVRRMYGGAVADVARWDAADAQWNFNANIDIGQVVQRAFQNEPLFEQPVPPGMGGRYDKDDPNREGCKR